VYLASIVLAHKNRTQKGRKWHLSNRQCTCTLGTSCRLTAIGLWTVHSRATEQNVWFANLGNTVEIKKRAILVMSRSISFLAASTALNRSHFVIRINLNDAQSQRRRTQEIQRNPHCYFHRIALKAFVSRKSTPCIQSISLNVQLAKRHQNILLLVENPDRHRNESVLSAVFVRQLTFWVTRYEIIPVRYYKLTVSNYLADVSGNHSLFKHIYFR